MLRAILLSAVLLAVVDATAQIGIPSQYGEPANTQAAGNFGPITATRTATGATRPVDSDDTGNYPVAALLAGKCAIKVEQGGLRTQSHEAERVKPKQRVIASGPNVEAEIAAIQRLRERDIAASKAADFDALKTLFTDDAVVMPPGKDFVRTTMARDASMNQAKAAMAGFIVLEYHEDFEELRILGDHAIEWGTISGKLKDRNTGRVDTSAYKVLRVLRRQPDGEWKILYSIFNDLPAPKGS